MRKHRLLIGWSAFVFLILAMAPRLVGAQPQSRAQQRCINVVNRQFARVANVERKQIVRCMRKGRRGLLPIDVGVEACASGLNEHSSDVRNRAIKKANRKCWVKPDFSYSSPENAVRQAVMAERAFVHEIFGPDLDASVGDLTAPPPWSNCQVAVANRAKICEWHVVKQFNLCKKRGLKGSIQDAAGIRECEDYDPKGKIARHCGSNIGHVVEKQCEGLDLDLLFPGCAGGDLVACIASKSKARLHLALDAANNLSPIRALVFSRTAGFRHPSIANAHEFFANLDPTEGMRVFVSEDSGVFSDAALTPIDALVFANTTGDILDETQQLAMQRFIRSGRGYVGVHSASDTEHSWPWYGRLVGAYFRSHPLLPVEVEVTTEDPGHPSTDHFDETFIFTDEIYNFDRNPRQDSHVLLTVDEAGFTFPNFPEGDSMGEDHPIAWYRQFDGARSFYTNLGHRPETWEDERFIEHLLEGIRWVTEGVSYNRIIVTDVPMNPLALSVTPEGDVYYIERTGEVMLWRVDTGRVVEAGRIDVDTAAENGLLGITLDPDFESNRTLYLYHSEPIPDPAPLEGPPGSNTLSRFAVFADGTIDVSSRIDLLRVPSDRDCCHEGGALEFGPDGSLFLSTGDNTNPHESNGYAPIDEREGRELFNAQRTASNPFDLRGKILRIRSDGSIPAGNLFPADGLSGRPEIFAMGTRNPFRLAIDPLTGRVYWGDVGPDGLADSTRGSRGLDEINFADTPGDYGWPTCIGDNVPYADYDFETELEGPLFDCSGKVPSVLSYDYFTLTERALGTAISYPELSGFTGRTAIAGAYYRKKRAPAPFALPEPYVNTLLASEWTRDLLLSVDVDEAGNLNSVRRLVPWERFIRPIDIELAPDGAMYVLEFGSEFFGDNPDARLSRVEYSTEGLLTPSAVMDVQASPGVPGTFELSASRSRAPALGESIVGYEWDFNNDGVADSHLSELVHQFDETGLFSIALTVVTDQGRRSIPTIHQVIVGNATPVVTITSHADGITVPAGAIIELVGTAVDAEDGTLPCETFHWDRRLGHNSHTHPSFLPVTGCTLRFNSTLPDHGDSQGLFWAIELSVDDLGGPGGEPVRTGRASIRIDVGP